jgi:hypothetical protein
MTLNIKQPVDDQDPGMHGRNEELEVEGPEVEGHFRRSPAAPDYRAGPEAKLDVERTS